MNPDDPLRSAALDNAVGDGWQGARIGHRRRLADGHVARQVPAEIDLGEPGRPLVVGAFLVMTLLATAYEFQRLGVTPTAAQLDGLGGPSAIALHRGDWWTVVTGNLLHGSLTHVALNAFVILLAGRWTEHMAGRAIMAATILWAMVFSMVGALMAAPTVVTVGASGVAFGILGCAIAIDPRARTAAGGIARVLAIVNVVSTFAVPGISIGGHVGGLLIGLVVGRLCWTRRVTDGRPIGRPRVLTTWITTTTAVLFVLALLLVPLITPSSGDRWGRETAEWLVSRSCCS
jgi:membrane associated rhomboid family serine protease